KTCDAIVASFLWTERQLKEGPAVFNVSYKPLQGDVAPLATDKAWERWPRGNKAIERDVEAHVGHCPRERCHREARIERRRVRRSQQFVQRSWIGTAQSPRHPFNSRPPALCVPFSAVVRIPSEPALVLHLVDHLVPEVTPPTLPKCVAFAASFLPCTRA